MELILLTTAQLQLLITFLVNFHDTVNILRHVDGRLRFVLVTLSWRSLLLVIGLLLVAILIVALIGRSLYGECSSVRLRGFQLDYLRLLPRLPKHAKVSLRDLVEVHIYHSIHRNRPSLFRVFLRHTLRRPVARQEVAEVEEVGNNWREGQ